MSKEDESGGWPQTEAAQEAAQTAPTFCAVEEHAAALGISAPVFAAVKQSRGWAAGKKVEKTDFKKAVNAFLKAPMGGSR